MSVLATFDKQPAEVQDYDIDFNPYLSAFADTALSATVISDSGVTIVQHSMTAGVVKVWVSGGLSGQKYKITAQLTTTGGRVKEGEIVVRVKEV